MANENENTPPAEASATDTMLEQAHDIGEATAKLDLLGAAHETLRAGVEDVKGSVSWLGDRVGQLETTIAKIAEDVAALKPIAAAEAGVEGAEGEAAAAIDALEPQDPTPNVAPSKHDGFMRKLHNYFS